VSESGGVKFWAVPQGACAEIENFASCPHRSVIDVGPAAPELRVLKICRHRRDCGDLWALLRGADACAEMQKSAL